MTSNPVDNDLYDAVGDIWWQPNAPLHLIHTSVNPARIGYFKKTLFDELKIDPRGRGALEVGCGGGLLCEEIARMGFEVTGIDPAGHALDVAARHAEATGLRIKYEKGTGESLPCGNGAFDVVFCCDVLEHVGDLPKVVSEISRVLKPGGVFCYDTINRTFASKLVAIDVAQVWPRWALAPPGLHVWGSFIRPGELRSHLGQNDLQWKEHRGMRPNVSLFGFLRALRKRAKGELTYQELGAKLFAVESHDTRLMYMGYAVKKDRPTK